MKLIYVLGMVLMLLFAGCSQEYSFDENDFEGNIKLDAKVEGDNADVVVDANVNISKEKVEEVVDYSRYVTVERLEDDGTIYIKNRYKDSLNFDLSIPVASCENKVVLEVNKVNKIELKGCDLDNIENAEVVLKIEGQKFSFNLVVKASQGTVDNNDKELKVTYDAKNNGVVLDWKKYDGDKSNFKYYKVVHSTTNSDLKYPEDGYIAYITDIDKSHFETSKDFVEDKTNYYRITTVLKSGNKLHSNVEVIDLNSDQGEQSQEKITKRIELIQVYATNTQDNIINENDKILIIVRLPTGDAAVKLSDLSIKLDSKDGSQIIKEEDYSMYYMTNNGEALKEGYLSSGDLLKIKFANEYEIGEGEDLTLRFLAEDIGIKPYNIKTPLTMTESTTFLYP